MGDLLYPALSRVLSSSWPQLYPSVQYSRPFWHWYPMRPPTHWGSLGMGDVAKVLWGRRPHLFWSVTGHHSLWADSLLHTMNHHHLEQLLRSL